MRIALSCFNLLSTDCTKEPSFSKLLLTQSHVVLILESHMKLVCVDSVVFALHVEIFDYINQTI